MRHLVWALFLGLAGCSAPTELIVHPHAAALGTEHPIFVGTVRAPDDDLFFNSQRNPEVSYLRADISVPIGHTPGNIEWPGRRKADPEQHFVATQIAHFDQKTQFQADLCREMRARPKHARSVSVYVHGFNNKFSNGVFRAAQMAHDFGYPEVTAHFSWPSSGIPFGYGYDSESTIFARDGLEEFLRSLRGGCADQILIVGHSLGGFLVMETMRQVAIRNPADVPRLFSSVFLVSPDIDLDVFRSQVSRIPKLPKPFVVFTSAKDQALAISAALTGQKNRLGNVTDQDLAKDLPVILVDVTEFSESGKLNHFIPASSPAAIALLAGMSNGVSPFDAASGNTGLVPGTVLSVRKLSRLLLGPVTGE